VSDVTGVELGPDYCVLVRATRHGSRTTVSAARTIGPDEWPEDSNARTAVLDQVRRSERFPSKARVVQWRSADIGTGASQSAFLRSLGDAGFEVESAQTPGHALAQLVRDRRLDSDRKAVAAIALNTFGAVIAIVSDGAVISSRTFAWTLGTPFSGSRPELLERYLVVSQLAPHLEHIIELVRPVYGAHVASIVLCGNLPNLRSLAMLLIAELDIEVETLDSADLINRGERDDGSLAESPAALQLAAAASLADGARPPLWTGRQRQSARAGERSSLARPAIGVVAFMLASAWAIAQLSGASKAIPVVPGGTVAAMPSVPDLRAEATMGRVAQERPPAPDSVHPPAPDTPEPPTPPVRATAPVTQPAPAPAPAPPRAAVSVAAPVPLPRVDGVMIAAERRLAIVDGTVVTVGDSVRGRSIVRIEPDGITLREPSGKEIFVAVRSRKRETGGS
jgi:hypothetical protein